MGALKRTWGGTHWRGQRHLDPSGVCRPGRQCGLCNAAPVLGQGSVAPDLALLCPGCSI